MNKNKYNRGSEWRKWDLHVHAPSRYTCAKNDQFVGKNLAVKQNNFIVELKMLQDISVLGITDYFSIDGYKKVIDLKDDLKNIDLILPNIELRLSPETNDGKKINIHIIPNMEILITTQIEEFLYKFEHKQQGVTHTCRQDSLISLGKKIDNSLSDEKAFVTGLNQFSITYQKFFEIFNKQDNNFKNNILIGVSNNSTDGASGIKDLISIRNIIYEGVDFIFSAQSSDKKYFLGQSSDNIKEIITKYNSLKPCIHGSDYHGGKDNKKICIPDLDRFCWVKAEPTFEGLKQIIYEPEERVKIQKDNPEMEKKHWKLDRLIIENSKIDIFPSQEIVFNSYLTSIIGGRGAGKSALLNLIVFLNGSRDSFIEWLQAEGDLAIKMIFLDKDGNKKEYNIKLSSPDNQFLPIYFLSQEDIEKFSDETRKEEHRRKFLDIIGIDDSAHYYHEETLKAESLITTLRKIDQEEMDTEKEIQTIAEDKKVIFDKKHKLSRKITILISQLKKEKDKYSTKSTKNALDAISKLTIKGNRLTAILNSDLKARISTRAIDLNDLIEKYQGQFDNDFDDDFKKEILKLSKYDILDTSEFIKFTKNNEEKTQKYLDELRKDCAPYIIILKKRGITDYKNITEEIELIDKLIIKLEKYNNRLVEIKTERNTVFIGFVTVFDEYKKSIKNAEKDIETKFLEFTDGKAKLFNKIFSGIKVSAGIYFDKQEFINEMQKCFYSGHSKCIDDFINKLDTKKYESFFNAFNSTFLEKITTQKDSKDSFLKDNSGYYTLIETIYQKCMNQYVYVHPKIELYGRELGSMSGGQQATLMLKLKLASEGLGKDIIILDQPENHLDNKFINDNLIDLIKILKKEKQVIIASHNANLVVGGDAEEIIISKMDNTTDRKYISGSIENPLIKIEIINILEGGKTAFDQRRKKYNL